MHESPAHSLRKFALYIPDLFSARHHSTNFRNTRSGYLRSRLTLLASLWGGLVLLWIPFDLMHLPSNEGPTIAISRVFLALSLFVIAHCNYHRIGLKKVLHALLLVMLCINAFYFHAVWVLGFPTVYSGYIYGYTLLPIIHIAMLTILPLTLKESLFLLIITAIPQWISDTQSQRWLTPENLADYWLQLLLALIVIWSQLSKLYMLMRLYRQASLDPLTGVFNRRVLLQLALKSLHTTQLEGKPFSVLLFDLDKFKRINDNWGHTAGDHILQAFAQHIQQYSPKEGLFGRYGGEEFILFVPGYSPKEAIDLANQYLTGIRQLQIHIDKYSQPLSITTSIGIATYSHFESISTLIDRADNALYECKKNGRDCCLYQSSCNNHITEQKPIPA